MTVVEISELGLAHSDVAFRSFYDREPAITIRQYAPYLVAEVTAEGKDMREAISDGFRQVRLAAHLLFVF